MTKIIVSLAMSKSLLQAIDDYRRRQAVIPSRSATVEFLLKKVLSK